MKAWMKVLMWLGLGAGVGFFAGMQVGQRQERKAEAARLNADILRKRSEMTAKAAENVYEACEAFQRASDAVDACVYALNAYRGGDISAAEGTDRIPEKTATDEDDIPPMPTEEDIQIPDIPVLHPTQLVPVIISESEYEANEWEYDKEKLVYYAGDDVLYNSATQSIIENPNDVLGIGTLIAGFGGDPKNPVDVIYVKNETYGTLFRVEQVDDAFCDAVDGTAGPEDDDPEEDEFWNDI